jgi:hypothetical protein
LTLNAPDVPAPAATIRGVTEVVSGVDAGADEFGEKWAKINNIPVKIFKADWKTHGRAAGPIRNKQMAELLMLLLLRCSLAAKEWKA